MVNESIRRSIRAATGADEAATGAGRAATGAGLMCRSRAASSGASGVQFKAVHILHVQDEADLRLLSVKAGGAIGVARRSRALRM